MSGINLVREKNLTLNLPAANKPEQDTNDMRPPPMYVTVESTEPPPEAIRVVPNIEVAATMIDKYPKTVNQLMSVMHCGFLFVLYFDPM
tara:strand:- start:110 stop:376 length:267 start_codon:yes stop_codon:yes gene_type:complete